MVEATVAAPVLREIGEPKILSSHDQFVAAGIVEAHCYKGICIKFCDINFKRHFEPLQEVDVPESIVGQYETVSGADISDFDAITALGDDPRNIQRVRTYLVHACDYLQGGDPEKSYVFYIRDAYGDDRPVLADWTDHGWCLSCYTISRGPVLADQYILIAPTGLLAA